MKSLLAKKTDLHDKQVRVYAIVILIVVGMGILASYVLSNAASVRQRKDQDLAGIRQSDELTQYLEGRLSTYQQILFSAAGLVSVKGRENLSQSDWRHFVEWLQNDQRAAEVLGIGYARRTDEGSDIDKATSAITYIEPFNDINQRVVGYDMFSESNRRVAMRRAALNGTVVMTAPVVARQDIAAGNSHDNYSILLYYPVYQDGVRSPEESLRPQLLRGWVYAIVRATDIMQNRDKSLFQDGVTYSITDVAEGQNKQFFSNKYGASGNNLKSNSDNYQRHIDALGRKWQTDLSIPKEFISHSATPLLVFITGVLLSSMLGAILFGLLSRRHRDVVAGHRADIQRTKDEILALASHQLRTPATGVRQYLAMLEAGYFGNLNKEQAEVANKASLANNRQLEIIDQLLYVAKADAGQLMIKPANFDLAAMLKATVESFSEDTQQKKISVRLKSPDKLMVLGDSRYIQMVLDNLISNAIKYSYTKSSISINLRSVSRRLELSITDKGVGIAEDDMNKLFKKFSRIENPLSRTEGGSGLGLFLAQKLARAHGGRIKVQSVVGKGSSFILTMPIQSRKLKSVIQITESA